MKARLLLIFKIGKGCLCQMAGFCIGFLVTFVIKSYHMQLPWHLYVMAVMYILAGINHFRKPRLYLKIIPPYFPRPKLLNALSGLAEIALGILLCIPATSPYAALGLIALLICVFPANLFMYQNETARLGFSKWLLLLRLPLQVVLIIWAYAYTPLIK